LTPQTPLNKSVTLRTGAVFTDRASSIIINIRTGARALQTPGGAVRREAENSEKPAVFPALAVLID
jgi:hypothetical protein